MWFYSKYAITKIILPALQPFPLYNLNLQLTTNNRFITLKLINISQVHLANSIETIPFLHCNMPKSSYFLFTL